MRVGPVVVILGLDPEASGRSRGRAFPDGHRHHKERLVALHNIGHAVRGRNFHAHIRRIGRKGGRQIIGFVGTHGGVP